MSHNSRSRSKAKSKTKKPEEIGEQTVAVEQRLTIQPRTPGQRQVLEAIKKNTITVIIGPAGSGKTLISMASAVSMLRAKEIDRIVLSRPVIESGESMGYLPGNLEEKSLPYLIPLYDALRQLSGESERSVWKGKGQLETAPLNFMRGRNFHNSFVILDEAQNATLSQIRMFLSRLGEGTKMVLTGDLEQSDIVPDGLRIAAKKLDGIDGIAVVKLTTKDIVRHPLIPKILNALKD